MRQGVWTAILTPIAAAAGMTCITPRVIGLSEPGTTLEVFGLAFLLLSAGGGLLLHRMYRQGCRQLVDSTQTAAQSRDLRPLNWPDDHLSPLVAALNGCMTTAESAVSEAEAEMRRLAIELKIVGSRREHAEAVIGSIEDAVVVTDPFDEVVLLNAAAGRLFELPETGIENKPVEEVIADAETVAMIRDMRQSRSTSRRIVERQMMVEGRQRNFRVTLARLGDTVVKAGVAAKAGDASAGAYVDRAAGVVAVLRDTTREAEIQQAKNDFVSSVTHELRTPLSSIRAYVEMLIDGEADDEKTRNEFYEIIQNEAQRLGTLIDNILNISRIESGLVKIDRRPQSPMLIAEKALEVIGPQAKLKNIEIRKEMLPAIFQVIADGDLLYQVVLNLLSNAVKYTPEGGRVILRTEADEARGVIITKVIDNGAGIPEADLPRMFEKFFRVEKNKNLAKGTGLGLSLVKRVIERDHDGRVFIESVEGKGSTFGFELPMAGRRLSESPRMGERPIPQEAASDPQNSRR